MPEVTHCIRNTLDSGHYSYFLLRRHRLWELSSFGRAVLQCLSEQ